MVNLQKAKRLKNSLMSNLQSKIIQNSPMWGNLISIVDATVKVTGEAKYTGDLKLPGMVFARILTTAVTWSKTYIR